MARLPGSDEEQKQRPWGALVVGGVLPLAVIGMIATVVLGGRPQGASGATSGHGLDVSGHFLLAAAVILAAARLGGLLAEWLRQPRVVGEICAGLALGPSLFGRFAPDAAGWLFPQSAQQLLNGLAQLGLVLFMFGVGRELSGMRLRGAAMQALLISQASMLVPFALGTTAAVLLLDYAAHGVHPLAFVLFVGCALSITAFPVLARILADLGIMRTPAGRLSLFASALGDGGSWLILAAILAGAHGSSPVGVLVNALAAIVIALFYLGPLRRLLVKWPTMEKDKDGSTTMVLLVVLVTGTAALTASIGLHQLIGALLVGVAWPKGNRTAVVAAERLVSTAASVLLPFFFFGFGLTLDLGALRWGASSLVTLAGLLALAVLGKVLGPALVSRMTGMPWRPAFTLGVLLNARGLTELVVLQIGYQAGIIDRRLLAILTLVALITTAMTTPMLNMFGLKPDPASDAKETAEGPERTVELEPTGAVSTERG
ncbi:cation:proton antiporter [Streptomyces sp. MCA2]|uniref:cation:proton antiporter domain-containing protein n=1 Tax=Streptomyces sp. MCA2 TaxID=2944805 RepID=UPI002020B7B4|nr:cation:proton antiporter [Streptomyces sp. MCA2]MCL7491271.1 cation:proton antiporter [Streptomyces sp. MCA2]